VCVCVCVTAAGSFRSYSSWTEDCDVGWVARDECFIEGTGEIPDSCREWKLEKMKSQ